MPGKTRTVRAFAAAEMMALHHARETAAFADADHVYLFLGLELIDQDLVAGLEIIVARTQMEFTHEARPFHSGLLQMPGHRLVDARRLDKLHQAELHRIVAVGSGRLALYHHARTRLHQRHRHGLPVWPEHLRHTDLFAKDSWTHIYFFLV